MKFAKERVNWRTEKWRNILWTDESKVVLFGEKGSRQFVMEWPAQSPDRCRNLVDSMGRRCKAVIKNNGYSTKY